MDHRKALLQNRSRRSREILASCRTRRPMETRSRIFLGDGASHHEDAILTSTSTYLYWEYMIQLRIRVVGYWADHDKQVLSVGIICVRIMEQVVGIIIFDGSIRFLENPI